jgi:hypothetical protein
LPGREIEERSRDTSRIAARSALAADNRQSWMQLAQTVIQRTQVVVVNPACSKCGRLPVELSLTVLTSLTASMSALCNSRERRTPENLKRVSVTVTSRGA